MARWFGRQLGNRVSYAPPRVAEQGNGPDAQQDRREGSGTEVMEIASISTYAGEPVAYPWTSTAICTSTDSAGVYVPVTICHDGLAGGSDGSAIQQSHCDAVDSPRSKIVSLAS